MRIGTRELFMLLFQFRKTGDAGQQAQDASQSGGADNHHPVHIPQHSGGADGRHSGLGHSFDRPDTGGLDPRTNCSFVIIVTSSYNFRISYAFEYPPGHRSGG